MTIVNYYHSIVSSLIRSTLLLVHQPSSQASATYHVQLALEFFRLVVHERRQDGQSLEQDVSGHGLSTACRADQHDSVADEHLVVELDNLKNNNSF